MAAVNWRIYRLPGSREIWHIDAGCGTPVFNVRGYEADKSYSKDVGGNHVPRAWVQVDGQELHIVNGFAIFRYPIAEKMSQDFALELEPMRCKISDARDESEGLS